MAITHINKTVDICTLIVLHVIGFGTGCTCKRVRQGNWSHVIDDVPHLLEVLAVFSSLRARQYSSRSKMQLDERSAKVITRSVSPALMW